MYPYLLKRKFIWRFVQLPNSMTTSQNCFLYYLSVWKIFSKNSFFLPSQGVSLSIADAKVDTFSKLTKHSWDFFQEKFNNFTNALVFNDKKISAYLHDSMKMAFLCCKTWKMTISLSLHSSAFGNLIYYIEAGQYIIYSIAYAFTEQ